MLTEALADAVPVLALALLLAVAYASPRPAVEAGAAVGASALVLVVGSDLDVAWEAVHGLLAVVGFLAAILVVAEVCARAGLFAVAAGLLTRGGASPVRLFTVAFVLAAATTAVLSLDATVVLLTPLVVAAALGSGLAARPGAYACLRMANSASLLLPVSNLTNLLAVGSLSLTFVGFAATMAPVLVAVLVVEYVGLRLLLRRDLVPAGSPAPTAAAEGSEPPDAGRAVVPGVVVVLMLVGFAVTSPLGVEPVWVAAVAAVALAVWAARRHLLGAPGVVAAAKPEFVLFVLALGVVVAAIGSGPLGDVLATLVPDDAGLLGLLVIAVIATVLANLVTNLSATLLLVPLVAPLGDAAVLAALLGLNIGSGLTLTGSLANLLWRRTLAPEVRPGLADFHRISLLLTPPALLVAVGVLALVT